MDVLFNKHLDLFKKLALLNGNHGQQASRWQMVHIVILSLCLVFNLRTIIVILLKLPKEQTSNLLVGDFLYVLQPLGGILHVMDFCINVYNIMDRWLIMRQESRGHFHVFYDWNDTRKGHGLFKLSEVRRGKLVKIFTFIHRLSFIGSWTLQLSACYPVVVFLYVLAVWKVKTWFFAISSLYGLASLFHSVTFSVSGLFLVHSIMAISTEYLVALLESLKSGLEKFTTKCTTCDVQLIEKSIAVLIVEYSSVRRDILRHNHTLKSMIRHSVLGICPVTALGVLFFILDMNPYLRLFCMIGLIEFVLLTSLSIMRLGRIHNQVMSMYPMFNSMMARTSKSPVGVHSKLNLIRVIKELSSSKVPSFTVGNGSSFRQSTIGEYIVATISFSLLIITIIYH